MTPELRARDRQHFDHFQEALAVVAPDRGLPVQCMGPQMFAAANATRTSAPSPATVWPASSPRH
jgi:hypothetical protein